MAKVWLFLGVSNPVNSLNLGSYPGDGDLVAWEEGERESPLGVQGKQAVKKKGCDGAAHTRATPTAETNKPQCENITVY